MAFLAGSVAEHLVPGVAAEGSDSGTEFRGPGPARPGSARPALRFGTSAENGAGGTDVRQGSRLVRPGGLSPLLLVRPRPPTPSLLLPAVRPPPGPRPPSCLVQPGRI